MYKCRICGRKQYITILFGFKSEFDKFYSLKKCKKCSFVSIDPFPTNKELRQCYDPVYWQKNRGPIGKFLDLLYRFRMFSIVKDIKKRVPKKGRILDWGTGNGSLLKLFNKAGLDCLGIDLYRAEPENKQIINTTIEKADFPDESFDAITCFHVLEHLKKPLLSLNKAFKLLKPNGFLVIEVPNIASLGFKIFKKRWQPLEMPTHLNHFNQKSLEKIFELVGNTKIVKISFFSHRTSPSTLILSLFPFFSPKRMRKKHQGKYPLFFMIAYLILQFFAYPFAILESLLKQGAVIRMLVQKTKK